MNWRIPDPAGDTKTYAVKDLASGKSSLVLARSTREAAEKAGSEIGGCVVAMEKWWPDPRVL